MFLRLFYWNNHVSSFVCLSDLEHNHCASYFLLFGQYSLKQLMGRMRWPWDLLHIPPRHSILKNENLVLKWLLSIFFLKWENQLYNHLWHNFCFLLQYHSLYHSMKTNNGRHPFSTATSHAEWSHQGLLDQNDPGFLENFPLHQNLLAAFPAPLLFVLAL